jgi:dienelactone hydrolase
MRKMLICMLVALALLHITTPRSTVSGGNHRINLPGTSLLHIHVRENGLVGTLVVPNTNRVLPGILRLGGAEGGIQTGDAESLATAGYAVLAVAYFGIERLPADLEEIPLEYFAKAIAWMKSNRRIDSKRLGILGISRGSTLALLLPTVYHDFSAVVALAPSHVIWQSSYLNWDRYAVRSSLSYHGKGLPFVPYDFSNEAAMVGCNAKEGACAAMYDYSLNQRGRVEAALIPVERMGAPLLLISGKADTLWPSSKMSELVIKRLEGMKYPYEYRHIAYDDAGHCGINNCFGGGTPKGNQVAQEDLRKKVVEFFGRHLTHKQQAHL